VGPDPHVLDWRTDPHFISALRAWSVTFQTKVTSVDTCLMTIIFSDYFSCPGKATGPASVCVSMRLSVSGQ